MEKKTQSHWALRKALNLILEIVSDWVSPHCLRHQCDAGVDSPEQGCQSWAQIGAKVKNKGFFQISLNYILSHQAKLYRCGKRFRFVRFGANLARFWSRSVLVSGVTEKSRLTYIISPCFLDKQYIGLCLFVYLFWRRGLICRPTYHLQSILGRSGPCKFDHFPKA